MHKIRMTLCDIIRDIIRVFFSLMECYYKDICMFDVSQKEKKNDMHELVELNRA